ncbi:MAG: hypothetical protein ACREXV_17180 [Polaromonas sp.]
MHNHSVNRAGIKVRGGARSAPLDASRVFAIILQRVSRLPTTLGWCIAISSPRT